MAIAAHLLSLTSIYEEPLMSETAKLISPFQAAALVVKRAKQ